MTKWQYRTLQIVGNEIDLINEFGADGWELVAIVAGSENWEPPVAYFKRPIGNVKGPVVRKVLNNSSSR